jgi:hypothetical protein
MEAANSSEILTNMYQIMWHIILGDSNDRLNYCYYKFSFDMFDLRLSQQWI